MCGMANWYGGTIIDDVVPGHTGKGADFRLAEMKLRRLPGHLPHGRDRARRLALPARRPGRPRLGQHRRRPPRSGSRRPATSSGACSASSSTPRASRRPTGARRPRSSASTASSAAGCTCTTSRRASPRSTGSTRRSRACAWSIGDALHSLTDLGSGALRLDANGFLGVEKSAAEGAGLVGGPPAVRGRQPPHRQHGAQGRRVHLPGAEPDDRRHPRGRRGRRRPVLRLRQPPRLPPRAGHRRHRVPAADAAHDAGDWASTRPRWCTPCRTTTS